MSTALEFTRILWFYVRWVLIFIGVVTLMGAFLPVKAHSWYSTECCSGRDCAPVTADVYAEKDGVPGRLLTSEHGTVFVPRNFSRRYPSKDWSTHVCIGFDLEMGQPFARCVYEGGGV